MIDSIEGGNQVDVGYTDFSKAFDKVNHSLVGIKLDWEGFYGKQFVVHVICLVGFKSYVSKTLSLVL
jgi:predicted lipoprotein